ncbi:MAG: NADH-quinone oxidoreductase subunit NuoN [Phycicoccus sp.]|nr:NADH-quinone oxidoreductase subunit NuoN [Phycicoccus sp.]
MPAAFGAVPFDWAALSPMLVVSVGALLGTLVEAFVPRASRYVVQLALSVVTLLAALVALVVWAEPAPGGRTVGGSITIDGPALFMQGTLLVFGLLGVLLISERFGGEGPDAFTAQGATTPGSPSEVAATRAGFVTSEVFPLTLFAVLGMLMFVASSDLITMFVALEVLSLPLYIMTGLARRRRLLSQEGALKYFLLGAFSSAFYLFGAALLYGFAGSTDLAAIASSISVGSATMEGLLLPGVLLVLVGLLFKVGAVPFHSWTPDVYQGAPTPVTGFMAAATKLAAFGAILRFVYVGVASSRWDWQIGVAAIAALTMVVGAVVAVSQTDIKRLLAYSSIAHAGFILVGVLAFDVTAISGVMFYLLSYGLATLAAFGVIGMVRQGASEATHISQWSGLGRSHPVVAGVFSLLLLAFAGIPLTSGFTAKFAVFAPAVSHGGTTGVVLVVIGVLMSAITAYVYFRLLVLMWFRKPADDVVVLVPSVATTVAVTVGAIATVLLGVAPGLLLEMADQAAKFVL